MPAVTAHKPLRVRRPDIVPTPLSPSITELLKTAHPVNEVTRTKDYAFIQYEFGKNDTYVIWLAFPHEDITEFGLQPTKFLVHGPKVHGVVYKQDSLAKKLATAPNSQAKRLLVHFKDEGDVNTLINNITWRGEGATPETLAALRKEVWNAQPFDPFEL